jgi:hypothetical protein
MTPPRREQTLDTTKVGSAGTPGWDDKMCQTVAGLSNDFAGEGDQRGANGDLEGSAVAYQISNSLKNQVLDNCLVMD